MEERIYTYLVQIPFNVYHIIEVLQLASTADVALRDMIIHMITIIHTEVISIIMVTRTLRLITTTLIMEIICTITVIIYIEITMRTRITRI